jgi:hypothetical protein
MVLAERIERREYKYFIDEHTASQIRFALLPYCDLDAYAAVKPTRWYLIDSLYFDTPSFAFFRANTIGQCDRFKLRVRFYPEHYNGLAYFEVKGRCNDVIQKTRGCLSWEEGIELLTHPEMRLAPASDGQNRMALERFFALFHAHQARPVTLVRYEREAWVSRIDSYARVTFDRKIRSKAQESLSLRNGAQGWRSMDNPVLQEEPEAKCVLELKFTSAVPRWMMSIVQRFDLLRSSFSKYGTSIVTWYRDPSPLLLRGRGVAA